jgi:hypothetical protein
MQIKFIGKKLSQMDQNTVKIMLQTLFKIINDNKRKKMVNWSLEIYQFVYKTVGEKNFIHCLKVIFSQE